MKVAYSALETALDERVEPVYLLSGDQDLLRELAAAKIQRAVVGDDPSPFVCERFDGESGSVVLPGVSTDGMVEGTISLWLRVADSTTAGRCGRPDLSPTPPDTNGAPLVRPREPGAVPTTAPPDPRMAALDAIKASLRIEINSEWDPERIELVFDRMERLVGRILERTG